jgi:hypothetical protein
MNKKIKYCWIVFLISGLASCMESKQTKEIAEENTKPIYSINLHIWYRRTTDAFTWKNLTNNSEVHLPKQGLIFAFRLTSVNLIVLDSTYDFFVENAVLKSYCKDSLIETNTSRIFGGPDHSLYSGQNGLLECTDWEELSFKVYYRKSGADISTTRVDSLKYKIILDQTEGPDNSR